MCCVPVQLLEVFAQTFLGSAAGNSYKGARDQFGLEGKADWCGHSPGVHRVKGFGSGCGRSCSGRRLKRAHRAQWGTSGASRASCQPRNQGIEPKNLRSAQKGV